MNTIIQSLINEVIQIEISGKKLISGTVLDVGSDMIVLFNGADFVYVPIVHIQRFWADRNNENDIKAPTEFPSIVAEESKEALSFGEVLTQAKGKFVEIYVTGAQPLHGYITSIMDNYVVFQSPIYKTMYISLNHLKWLIPYAQNERPYGLDNQSFSFQPNDESLANTLEVQVGKIKNKIVVLNIGGNKSYVGKINNVEAQIVEVQTARTQSIFLNIDHIKTLHQV
ncbi:DUF2642 domain-containing protein [Sporosarcina sp. FSL K6-1522]|uniref:DUF2642 domain-containing protein n=1 Tax=Sporosarcina sp. FSL K6-1522 TaxID=2921554 RepID=UPI00315AD666